LRVDAGLAQQIESNEALWEQLIPQIQRRGWVSGTEARNEMILERADGSFSGVASMNMWRCQLKINVRGDEEILECACCFIVETLEEGFESSRLQEHNTPLVSGNDGRACAIDHRLGVNAIAVIFVYDKDVLVA
jgi:hypothetical protein